VKLFKAAADMLNKSVEMVTLLPNSGQGMKLILDYKKSLEAGSAVVTRYTAMFYGGPVPEGRRDRHGIRSHARSHGRHRRWRRG